MKQTTELRWFFDHPLPFAECATFSLERQPVRHDFYLRGSGERLGIKWREGNLEIKQQLGETRNYQHQEVAGYLEHWKKWSFPVAEKGDFDQEDEWLEVTKQRLLARFAYCADTRTVIPVADEDDEQPANCEVEYTQLTVEESDYYTVGLEASGEVAYLAENMFQTVHYLAKNTILKKLGLELARSSNYARWIQQRTTT